MQPQEAAVTASDHNPAAAADTSDADMQLRILGLGLAAALAHALVFIGYIVDDAYISFRYARHLAHGQGCVFNLGERVEGYTNFSWVLLMAAGEALGVPPSMSAPVLGLLTFLGLLCVVARAARAGTESIWAGAAALSVLAAYTGMAFYSVSGLETLLFALWLTLAALALAELRGLAFGVHCALAALTRPEAGLLAVLGCAYLMHATLTRRAQRRELLRAVAALSGMLAPYAVFKWLYFGSLLPNTLSAKQPDLAAGLRYGLEHGWPLLGLFAMACVASLRDARARLLTALFALHWLAVVFEGGDWFPAERMFVPYLAWLALAADSAFCRALSMRSTSPKLSWVYGGVLLVFVALQLHASSALATKAHDTQAMDEGRSLVAAHLHAKGYKRVAAHDIGLLGYLLADVHIVDLGGLTDKTIARSPGGYGTKRPPLDYLAQQAPDSVLIATEAPVGDAPANQRVLPLFAVEAYVSESAWFRTHYRHDASFGLSHTYHLHVFVRSQ